MRKIFIIDIDGCICEHIDNENPEGMKHARPFPESITKINEWYEQGHHVCFFTARTEEHRKATVEWLRKHGVKYDQLILGKPRRGSGASITISTTPPLGRQLTKVFSVISLRRPRKSQSSKTISRC